MEKYKPAKGISLYYIMFTMVLYNAFIMLLLYFTESYVLFNLLKVFIILFNIYELYYVLLSITLRYGLDEKNLYIIRIFGLNKTTIPLADIKGYSKSKGIIKGVKLSGFARHSFAYGKSVIQNIGTSKMYVTSNKCILYLRISENLSYALSPRDYELFEKSLTSREIELKEWEPKFDRDIHLHKDKKFMIPLLAVSAIILIITITPFILYLKGVLPDSMPLNFDTSFNAVKFGTGKQFAFSQMVYGVLNMAVLFCMYYASYFYAKYDRKSANKFILGSLAVALVFLVMQFRVIMTFI